MHTSRKAVSVGVVLSVIAILIVAAAAGVYLSLSHRSSPTTSGASSSTQASSTVSSTVQTRTTSTSVQQSTTSLSETTTTSATAVVTTATATTTTTTIPPSTTNTQTSCPTSTATTQKTKIPNIDRLFGNFSSMSVEYKFTETNSSGSPNSVSMNSSYIVTGQPTINSVQYYVVSVNSTIGGSPQHLTIWYPPDGNATKVEENGYNFTGTQATDFAFAYMASFYALISFQTTQLNALLGSNLKVVNQTSVTLGPTQMTVTTYEPQTLPFKVNSCSFSATLNSLVLQAGTVPGTSFDLLTYIYENGVFQSANITFFFKVLSVQKA
jgi:hypothetical protein